MLFVDFPPQERGHDLLVSSVQRIHRERLTRDLALLDQEDQMVLKKKVGPLPFPDVSSVGALPRGPHDTHGSEAVRVDGPCAEPRGKQERKKHR